MLIIDSRMRKFEKEKLKELGYSLYEIKCNKNLYYEISSHPDIHCCKISNKLFVSPDLNITNAIIGNLSLNTNYPFDVPYNVCILGNKAIHNFKYTDSKINNFLDENTFEKIQINQGYSKCSIAVIDENSVIVANEQIAKILLENNINVLCLPYSTQKNIHLYKNEYLEYSDMNGFIGGCISRIDDIVFVSGDLNYIDTNNNIRNFILERNLKIINFHGQDIIDYGGILQT